LKALARYLVCDAGAGLCHHRHQDRAFWASRGKAIARRGAKAQISRSPTTLFFPASLYGLAALTCGSAFFTAARHRLEASLPRLQDVAVAPYRSL
jgi:hypothetical protein